MSWIGAAVRHTPRGVRGGLTLIAIGRLARGRSRRPALVAPGWAVPGPAPRIADEEERPTEGGGPADDWPPAISVVIPARNEAAHLAAALEPLREAPGVVEVIVVDDRSTDATAEVAREHGALVIEGQPLPRGWAGKPWAMQQGLVAAQGHIVVFLDADVRPDPALPAAVTELLAPQRDVERQLRAEAAPAEGATPDRGDSDPARVVGRPVDLASAQLALSGAGLPERLLDPALRATLLYRLGPLDTTERIPASMSSINGQCFAVRRDALISAGGFSLVSNSRTDDTALARALAGAGWRITVGDGTGLGSAERHATAAQALGESATRRLALGGAASRPRQLLDLGVIWVVQGRLGLRVWRALLVGLRQGSPSAALRALKPTDLALLVLRIGVQSALARTYRVRVGKVSVPDPVSLAAPLTDPVAFAALARGTVDRRSSSLPDA
ncbi:MAG: glycosyltransferase [Solirubrobacteraceae bacterium]|nr:glycosyltransferase [Solirubrobacteraceae bacterium]